MLTQRIAVVTDASTGYQIEIVRRDNDDYSVSYVYTVLAPAGADLMPGVASPHLDGQVVEVGKESIRLQSNGCGSMALIGG